jgi:hypothetical protein
VLAAVKKSVCVERTNGNTVLTIATLPFVTEMVAAMADALKIQAYQSAMAQAKIMLDKGIIDHTDLIFVEDILAWKYGLKAGRIYREIDLINSAFRANMA